MYQKLLVYQKAYQQALELHRISQNFPTTNYQRPTTMVVGERSAGIEADPGGPVEPAEVRMPVLVSEKAGENPARRKPEVSWGRLVRPGLVGT